MLLVHERMWYKRLSHVRWSLQTKLRWFTKTNYFGLVMTAIVNSRPAEFYVPPSPTSNPSSCYKARCGIDERNELEHSGVCGATLAGFTNSA